MKSIPAGLEPYVLLGTTHLATCWHCTWTNGQLFGFTDHDRDLIVPVVPGVTFEAVTGYTRTAIASSADLSVGNLDLEGAFDSAGITESDLRAGRWDYAKVRIFRTNWQNPSLGIEELKLGKLGQATAGRIRFTTEFRDLMQHLQQEIGRLYAPGDDVDAFDARHGVDPAAFTVTGTITGVVDGRQFNDTSRAEATGWFDHGKITFDNGPSGGLNAGLSAEIRSSSSVAGNFELFLPMPFVVAIGDTYSATAGYNKTIEQALSKFNAVINYRGFKWVPGTDQMMSGGI